MVQNTQEQRCGFLPGVRRACRHVQRLILLVVLTYLLTAYVVLPWAWKRFVSRKPDLNAMPRVTTTGAGIPGDPLNVALVGSEAQVRAAMASAHWFPADPLCLRDDVRIVLDTMFRRAYFTAPVSNLYLFGRREDLAFEKPVGKDPCQREHVRFWLTGLKSDGRDVWIGAATFDRSVGFSRTTGQVTHHIAPNIDQERNDLISDLESAGKITDTYWLDDYQMHFGKNGGGDPYRTDGALVVGVIGDMEH